MSQCRKRSLVPRGRELMLWLDKTMRAWRCAAGKEPGWDVGASEETAVAALPQFLQPSRVAAVWGDVAPLALPRLPSFCWHSHPCCGVRALPGWKPRSHLLWLGRVSVPWAPGVTAGAPAWAQRRRWRRTVSDGWESKTDLTLLSFADFGAGDSRAACREGLLVHWADWGSSTNQMPGEEHQNQCLSTGFMLQQTSPGHPELGRVSVWLLSVFCKRFGCLSTS